MKPSKWLVQSVVVNVKALRVTTRGSRGAIDAGATDEELRREREQEASTQADVFYAKALSRVA